MVVGNLLNLKKMKLYDKDKVVASIIPQYKEDQVVGIQIEVSCGVSVTIVSTPNNSSSKDDKNIEIPFDKP